MVAEQELTKSFNLYDVLPLEKSSVGRKKEDKQDVAYVKAQLDHAQDIFSVYEANGLSDEFDTTSKLMKKLVANANAKRTDYFLRNNKLPDTMQNSISGFEIPWRGYGSHDKPNVLRTNGREDSLTKLSKTPTIKVGNIKKLADSLDMIIFPFDYIDSKSYADESYSVRQSLNKFVGDLKTDFDLVVLAPLNHYSLTKHAKAEDADKGIYAGKHSIVFTSVLMNIPMFRSIINDLSDLRDNVDSLSGTISNVEKNMQMMQNQILNLQKQMEQQKEQLLQQQIQHNNEMKAVSARLSEMQFQVTDPVIFAIPKGTDINDMNSDEALGYVGPVWGPDFDGIALFQLDMEIIKNQRNTLNKTIEKIW